MNGNENLQALFHILNGCLPYEYDEKYLDTKDTDDSILIAKKESSRTLFLTANPDHHDEFEISIYDGDDKPLETALLTMKEPDDGIAPILTYIKTYL